MSANLTVFRLRADPLGQIAGNPEAPLVQPTWAANMVIDPEAGAVQQILGNATVSATATLTIATITNRQHLLILEIIDTGGVTVTFGTGFKSTGTVNPTTGKAITVAFIADPVAGVFREFSRSASAQ